MSSKLFPLATLSMLLTLLGCTRPQHVVYVDTDAPVLGQLFNHPELSADAAIDVVRIDVLDQHGQSYEVCEFVANEPSDWPLSFGVTPPPGEESDPTRLRIRGFRRLFARPDQLQGVSRICGKQLASPDQVSISDPRAEVTIERVIDLAPAVSAIEPVRVVLSLDCIGRRPSFLEETNCIDKAHLSAPFAMSADADSDPNLDSSVIGTSPLAQQSPCTAPAPVIAGASTVCIPGGFYIRGDTDLFGFDTPLFETASLQPVWISPFYMDKTEFTIGRVRAQQQRGVPTSLPFETDSTKLSKSEYCTWNKTARDQIPVNCLFPDSAALFCKQDGGFLPTETQWEYAARGRGQRRTYPWGNQPAECCTASLARTTALGISTLCAGSGVEPVGSHTGSSCPSGGDVSRDGVLDLGGSLSEFNRDQLRPYAERCGLQEGLSFNPLCPHDDLSAQSGRGSNWSAGVATALAARRSVASVSPTNGFRCIYTGVNQ